MSYLIDPLNRCKWYPQRPGQWRRSPSQWFDVSHARIRLQGPMAIFDIFDDETSNDEIVTAHDVCC